MIEITPNSKGGQAALFPASFFDPLAALVKIPLL